MKSRNRKKATILVLCSVAGFLLITAFGLFVWADTLLSSIRRVDPEQPTLSQEQLNEIVDQSDTTPLIDRVEAIPTGKNVINILLVGQDRRETEARMHSDAMILCTINKSKKTLTMTSVMRDLWVYIPGYYNNRMNVPYMVGGFELLNDTLAYNFGIRADYNIEMDFAGFMAAVDLVNGVDIELTAAEAAYLNRRGNWDVEENRGWTLTEGVNRLDGSQALAYSRIRDIGDDFGRTSRQRTVLTALMNKARMLDASEIYGFVKELLPLITTDMTNPQIMGVVAEVLPILNDLEIISQRIPMDRTWQYGVKGGADVILLTPENFAANRELLKQTMKE